MREEKGKRKGRKEKRGGEEPAQPIKSRFRVPAVGNKTNNKRNNKRNNKTRLSVIRTPSAGSEAQGPDSSSRQSTSKQVSLQLQTLFRFHLETVGHRFQQVASVVALQLPSTQPLTVAVRRPRPALHLAPTCVSQGRMTTTTEKKLYLYFAITSFRMNFAGYVGHVTKAQIPLGLTRLDTFDVSNPCILAVSSYVEQHSSTRSTRRARLARHVELDWLDTSSSTGATCNLVMITVIHIV